MEIKITPRWIAISLVSLISLLTLIHITLQSVRFLTDQMSGLAWFFSLGSDGNIPTFYSAFAILLCAAFLILLGIGDLREKKIPAAYWFVLALIFAFLSIDEMLMIHERLIEPVRDALNTSGPFYFAWIIPYGIALTVFLIFYSRLLALLPVRTRMFFIIAGMIFVTGAIGLEMLGGMQAETYGKKTVTYVALQTIEEILEMAGIALFAYSLADYADKRHGSLRLVIGS